MKDEGKRRGEEKDNYRGVLAHEEGAFEERDEAEGGGRARPK